MRENALDDVACNLLPALPLGHSRGLLACCASRRVWRAARGGGAADARLGGGAWQMLSATSATWARAKAWCLLIHAEASETLVTSADTF